jgi:hypothetical protein
MPIILISNLTRQNRNASIQICSNESHKIMCVIIAQKIKCMSFIQQIFSVREMIEKIGPLIHLTLEVKFGIF